MKKILKTTVAILILSILFVSPYAMAKKKKPKLTLPDAPENFSAEIPDAYTSASVRGTSGNSNDPIAQELNSSSPQKYITPNGARIYNSNAIFEWAFPNCSIELPCKVGVKDIEKEETIIQNNVTENKYIYNTEEHKLTPGKYYAFKVTQACSDISPEALTEIAGQIDKPIIFYVVSKKENKDIADKIKKINETDAFDKDVAELNLFVENGIWFDAITKLNNLMTENPEDKDLLEIKENLYNFIQKDNK